MKGLTFIFLIVTLAIGFDSYKVRVPYPGGYVSAMVTVPDAPRYAEGAPIVLFLPGGTTGGGSMMTDSSYANRGVIYIAFLLPGNSVGADSTTGIWDFRGIFCYDAIAAVMAYACGDSDDIAGGTIDDSAGCPVCTGIVGLL